MINFIWLIMIIAGTILAGICGQPEIITQSAFQAAQAAVKYSIELIGIMSLWLGLMKVAEEAGLIETLAKILRPFTRLLFPSLPSSHPALGSILMNFSANLLGLGNAATPFGLKAMQELQEINPNKEEASDAMCTFLAMNTANITLLPATIIGIRLAAGSTNPTEIIGTTLFATTIGFTIALIADGIMRYLHKVRGGD
ncbi:MAG: nucleoside recognition domain-containing protein [Clostridia bacterium]|nr:nucleoside recognition domain-containing protein [Clostridia bacterium]